MIEKEISIKFCEYQSIDALPNEDKQLMLEASKACKNAYSPYSNFKVGAAVKCNDGVIIGGNNQENAAYPSGLCAERVALFTASAQKPGVVIKSIAITVDSGKANDLMVAPCGACRQVIAEYELRQGSKIEILFSSETGRIIKVKGISSLLPFTFSSNNLPEKNIK